jgi:hypothetical protein
MAMKIILVDQDKNQVEILLSVDFQDGDWESESYQIGCNVAREIATRLLEKIEDQLFQNRPPGIRVKDIRKRTLVTRFGDITVSRRMYQDKQGEYHFLLDEYLNWRPRQAATPSLTEALVDSSTRSTFRNVSRDVEKYTAGVLSASTVHRLLQRVVRDTISAEEREHESSFEHGKLPPSGEKKAPLLFVEPDGIWLRLQQEEQKSYELKNAIAYTGWRCLSQKQERYALVDKRVYCHSHGHDSENSHIPFWDVAGLAWHKHWDLGYVKFIVLGGDDAIWIDKGSDALGLCIRHLSGFHLAGSCVRGWENGKEIYDAIRSGAIHDMLHQLLSATQERSGKTAQKKRMYVLDRLEKGLDWRRRAESLGFQVPEGVRGLGSIEGNQSHLFSDRMKDRGMSWTIKGAQHMGKAIELVSNGELKQWCGNAPSHSIKPDISFDLFQSKADWGSRASLPVLEGPHASRPWAKVMKNLAMPHYPLY